MDSMEGACILSFGNFKYYTSKCRQILQDLEFYRYLFVTETTRFVIDGGTQEDDDKDISAATFIDNKKLMGLVRQVERHKHEKTTLYKLRSHLR